MIRLLELGAASGYVNGSPCVDWVRAVKDADEQEKMRRSSAVNDACMAEFVKAVHIGATEKELEQKFIEIYAAHGCEGVSFTPIVGFGKNAADPHHGNDGDPAGKGDVRPFGRRRGLRRLLFGHDPHLLHRPAHPRGGKGL